MAGEEPRRYVRSSGVVHGDEAGLFPCVWIGFIDDGTTSVPWWREEVKKRPARARPRSTEVRERYVDTLKDGQFVFAHQCAGHMCHQMTLAGVVLPLAGCSEQGTAQAIESLTAKYFDQPFRGLEPDLDDLVAVRDDLRAIGPLDCTRRFGRTTEAFLEFECDSDAYDWLRRRFEMAAEIVDNDGYGRVEVTRTAALPADDLAGFVEWLHGPDERWIAPWWLDGGIVYLNSD